MRKLMRKLKNKFKKTLVVLIGQTEINKQIFLYKKLYKIIKPVCNKNNSRLLTIQAMVTNVTSLET